MMSTPEFNIDDWITIPQSPSSSGQDHGRDGFDGSDGSRSSSFVIVSEPEAPSSSPDLTGTQSSSEGSTRYTGIHAERKPQCSDGSSCSSIRAQGSTRNHYIKVMKPLLSGPSTVSITFVNADQASHGQIPKTIQKRSRMDARQLASFRETRKIRSCVQCVALRAQCGTSIPCLKCTSRGIPAELCCRDRMRDLDTFRAPGLAETFVSSYNGSIESWDARSRHAFKVWHGYGPRFTVYVTKYKPRAPIVDLFWKAASGWQNLIHTPYGIEDVLDLDARDLDAYSMEQVPFVMDRLEQGKGATSQVFVETFREALNFINASSEHRLNGLVRNAVLLWIHVFQQYHGLWQMPTCDTINAHPEHLLGMKQLVLHSHDVSTLTPFHGTIPLPRLLHQQIHTCVENRMKTLDASVSCELESELKNFRASKRDDMSFRSTALALYLSSFIYLSVLEEVAWDAGRWQALLELFDWPLDRTPTANLEHSAHAAQVVTAHFHSAFKYQNLWDLYGDLPTASKRIRIDDRPSTRTWPEDGSARIQHLKPRRDMVKKRKSATFDNENIRSLELRFAGLLLGQ